MTNRYWVGGTGDWSDYTNHWSASSGGPPGASLPTSSDNVILDTLSSVSNAAYTVVLSGMCYCYDFTVDGPDPIDATKVTLTGGLLDIYGNMDLVGGTAGITYSLTSGTGFVATTMGHTIATHGITIRTMFFQGYGGGWTLSDNFHTSSVFNFLAGTLDTNGKTVTCGSNFKNDGSETRSLILGSSIINVGANFLSTSSGGLTFDAGTSTIIVGGIYAFWGGDRTYYNVQLNGTSHTITGTNTFANLTRTGTVTKTDTLILSADQTITGTLILNGNSPINRLLVKSDILGTPRTITTANVIATNTDFQDITGSGTASWNLNINRSIEVGTASTIGGYSGVYLVRFTPTENVTTYYLATNVSYAGGGSFRIAIYSDNVGSVGTVLVESASIVAEGTGWQTTTISPSYTLNSGTSYWLGIQMTGVINVWSASSGGKYILQAYGTFPNNPVTSNSASINMKVLGGAATGGSGDCGGNTGIISSPATIWYYHEAEIGLNNWSTVGKWFIATNGSGSVATYPPLPQDTAKFDANSFDIGGITVTQDMPRIGNIDWTNTTNNPTWTTATNCSTFGSIILTSGMILTASPNDLTFEGRGEHTLYSDGKTWYKNIYIQAVTGMLRLTSDISVISTKDIYITSGTLTVTDGTNNYSISSGGINISSGGMLTLGSATHYITKTSGNGIVGNGVINAGTSTIKYTGALTGPINLFGQGNQTLYNFWNATTGAYPLTVYNSNTFNNFKIDAGRIVKFDNSTTQTVNTFTALGTSDSHITIGNTSGTTNATLAKTGGGAISGCDYIDIQNITGSPAYTWSIGTNSTDVGLTCTNIYLVDILPPNVAVLNITHFISDPCIDGNCSVNLTITWINYGQLGSTLVPNISIDGIPVIPSPYPSQSIGPYPDTVTRTFIVEGLTAIGSPHTICPYTT